MIHLGLYPFSFAVNDTVKSVYSNIATLYPAKLLDIGGFCDFNVSVDYRRMCGMPLTNRVNFYLDGFSPFAFNPSEHATAVFEWGMNWCVANHVRTHHIIHAATVAKQNNGVMLCGQSGSGKSTLSCALMAEGWRLLTDELTLLSLEHAAQVTPFVRPISIKEKAIDVLKKQYPQLVFGDIAHNTDKGTVTHVRPTDASWDHFSEACKVNLIVFPEFTPSMSEVVVEPVDVVEAFNVITEQSFNLNSLGATALKPLAELIESTMVIRLKYSSLSDAISCIEAWLKK